MTLTPHFILLLADSTLKKPENSSEHLIAIFLVQVALLLLFGRVLGELMQRIGQPAVMGQLIAGIIVGPSVFGQILPTLYHTVFPDVETQKRMIDAISQLGILMLLLLTGMETDLKLVNRMRSTAFFTSISGIVFPFICGYVLGEFLPDSMLPDPSRRLVTSLFIATALSISSVKIVAMVIMEVGFLRRNIGQIILASAILDDTIGWIIIAVIGGIAASGAIDIKVLGIAAGGTALFLGLAFTIGRPIVATAIRWTNDNFVSEKPVLTLIILLMIVMSLTTDFIGVHTVLGAFVVGILVGQSPILTRHIEGQLRGLIVALFAPIFFAVAGREIDLSILKSLTQIEIAIGFILVASVGKIVGCFIGSRLGRLDNKAATAIAIGMNARGSTEVIVATIGLSMGVLNRDLFTLIVVTAISTTLITPPLLRWALRRIPATGDEKERLEREEAEAKQFVPNIERVLIAADNSASGKLGAELGTLFSGARKITTTLLQLNGDSKGSSELEDIANFSITSGSNVRMTAEHEKDGETKPPSLKVMSVESGDEASVVLNESENGYDLMFLAADPLGPESDNGDLLRIFREFTGVCGVPVARGNAGRKLGEPLKILLPTTGTDYSQLAAEVAVTLAKASKGSLTALHVTGPIDDFDVLRRPNEIVAAGRSLLNEVKMLGEREDLDVRTLVRSSRSPEDIILKQMRHGRYDLTILGVSVRAGEKLFFGRRISTLLERSNHPLLLISASATTAKIDMP